MKVIQNNVVMPIIEPEEPRRRAREWFSRNPYADAFLCLSRRRGLEITTARERFVLQLFSPVMWFRLRLEAWGLMFMLKLERMQEVQYNASNVEAGCPDAVPEQPTIHMTASEIIARSGRTYTSRGCTGG